MRSAPWILIPLLAACAAEPEPRSSPTGRVATFTARLEGDGAGLRAAMLWAHIPAALESCLEVASTDEAIARCGWFHYEPSLATESVDAPIGASFEVPVSRLPEVANYRFSYGLLVAFEDGNANGTLDLTPLGAMTTIDTVVGATADPASGTRSYVIHRSGELSPFWKLFEQLGCHTPPAEGFSIARTDGTYCDLLTADSVLTIDINRGAYAHLVCAPQDYELFGYPTAPIPAGSELQCEGYEAVAFIPDPGAYCPTYRRYDLVGCSDATSEAACYASFWDLRAMPPSWWPCQEEALRFYLSDSDLPFTDAPGDELFALQLDSDNRGFVDPGRIEVVVDLGGGAETYLRTSWWDYNQSGYFDRSDYLWVLEPALDDLFNTATPAAASFGITVRLYGGEVLQTFTWVTRERYLPRAELALADAEGGITDGVDGALFSLRIDTLTADPAIAIDEVWVSVAVSGEVPVDFVPGAAPTGYEQAYGLRHVDRDNDGRLSPGDDLEVIETSVSALQAWANDVASYWSLRWRNAVGYDVMGSGSWTPSQL